MKTLSELLASYRTDRPDEWTMDEFKRAADALEAENARLRAEIDAANAQQSPAVAVPDEETNFCALKSITDSQVHAVARAFWRRIYAYRNHYGIELPKPLPVEFMAHMATALTWVDREPSPRITEQDAREIEDFLVEDYKREYVGQGIEAWLRSACRTLLTKLNEVNHAR